MKKKSKFIGVYLLLLLLLVNISAQAQDNGGVQTQNRKQGIFYISPFYEYTKFKKLELVSHTNHHKLYEGNVDYTLPDEQIQAYNHYYGTEYQNSLIGLKIGYHVLDGLGISAYVGVNHLNFESWVSDENTQTHKNEFPELTLGISAAYQTVIIERLKAIINLNFNYSKSGSVAVNSDISEDIISSQLTAKFWEVDLGFAYRINKFLPFVGVGYTGQYVNVLQEEGLYTEDDNGNDFYETVEFDSDFEGNSFYGFAGLEYSFNQNLSIYAKSSFINPFRANFGFRIIL